MDQCDLHWFRLTSVNEYSTVQYSTSCSRIYIKTRNSGAWKNIRKLVDEETLGISLGERRGIDILFGNIPKTGVIIDSKKEALRIKKNKLSKQDINSNPSPAVDINSGKPLLIK